MPRALLAAAAAASVAATKNRVAAPAATVSLASLAPVGRTEPTYVSWNVDSSCNRGFHTIDFSNANLVAAGGALRPSRVRFGGAGSDYLTYAIGPAGAGACSGGADPTQACSYFTPGCLNATHWAALYGFAQGAGAEMIFGLSFGLAQACPGGGRGGGGGNDVSGGGVSSGSGVRGSSGGDDAVTDVVAPAAYVWNSTNAAQLLADLAANGQTDVGFFELGNEINNQAGHCPLVAAQQAGALADLAGLTAAALPGARFVGPDTGAVDPQPWLVAYLDALPPGLLHAATHHTYNGATRADFNSPAQLDKALPEMAWFVPTVRDGAPGAQAWAGENGPDGGGDDGSCGHGSVCGTFASALWYADELGLRAKHGYAQHQRHDFVGGAYGLVNSVSGAMALNTTEPVAVRPDYWVAFLWKRTIGAAVLNATSSLPSVRAYAFAGSPPSPWAAAPCVGSPLQLVLVNLDNGTASTAVGLPPAPGGAAGAYDAWSLAPTDGPFGVASAVNGAPSPAVVDASVVDPATFLQGITAPALTGAVAAGVSLPPLSATFVCYHR